MENKFPWVTPLPFSSSADSKPFQPEAHGYQAIPGGPKPLPLDKPPFTFKELRDAIPAHCFKRSTSRGLFYILHNVGVCGGLFYASTWIGSLPMMILPAAAWTSLILWPAYWFLQGVYMFGLWLLAHECGHETISQLVPVNHVLGLLLHSFLLVPYHSWRITHSKHHMNTGSADNEETFTPPTRSRLTPTWVELLEESTLYNLLQMMGMLVVGFFPLYLVFNSTGPQKHYGKNANHFSPDAVFFLPEQRKDILVSNIVFFSWVGLLGYLCCAYSFTNVIFYYGMPQLVSNCCLVLVTYLHHTDTFIPHFRGEGWIWLRGALCTVDRSYGKWLDRVFHRITDRHVCHHICTKIPFYHLEEATRAISPLLGEYHLRDETPIWKALWRAFRNCKFVEDEGPVVFYKGNLLTN